MTASTDRIVYSEDFQHGREIEGVRFVNPFIACDSTTPT
jgi:predicted nucleic acid-binding protein